MVSILSILLDKRHYYTASRFLAVYPKPFDAFARYVLRKGQYPASVPVRTSASTRTVTLNSPADFATLNQIFGRHDYPAPKGAQVIMDVGANIGIASLHFLTHCPKAFVHAYEPDPKNITHLKDNLSGLTGRFELNKKAVSDFAGTANFGTEPTGRYGTLDAKGDSMIKVDVLDVQDEVDRIIGLHGRVDVLKVDIEGHEERVLRKLRPDQLEKIGEIYAEYTGDFIPSGFSRKIWGIVSHYRKS